jgi:hypothetical protein
MPSRVTEYFDEEIRATVDHLGLLLKVGGAIDHAKHFHDPGNAVQIAEGCFGRSQDLQSNFSRGVITLLDRHRAAELAALRLIAGSGARDKEQVAGLRPPDVTGNRLHGRRKLNSQVPDRLFSGHDPHTSFLFNAREVALSCQSAGEYPPYPVSGGFEEVIARREREPDVPFA